MRWRRSSAPLRQFSPSTSTVPSSGAVAHARQFQDAREQRLERGHLVRILQPIIHIGLCMPGGDHVGAEQRERLVLVVAARPRGAHPAARCGQECVGIAARRHGTGAEINRRVRRRAERSPARFQSLDSATRLANSASTVAAMFLSAVACPNATAASAAENAATSTSAA